MKARFDLAIEFGYADSDNGSITVDAIARTDNPYYYLIKLPQGYEPADFIRADGVVACCTDFLSLDGDGEDLPLWDDEQRQHFAEFVAP